jgi:ABC-type Fe3+/spermidine/putrescine transport system ATPase subunit
MSRGKALQIESATRLYEAPNCREVAEFIGSMNFFQGTLRNAGGGRAVVDAGPLGSLNAMLDGAPPPVGAAVSIAVRPEKLRLAWERPENNANAVAGKVNAQAYLGDRSHYYIAIPGSDRPIAVAYQNVDRSLDGVEAIGRPVWLTWPAESAVLLTR